jgi:hypothetical protein
MAILDDALQGDEADWISALPPYQRDIVNTLLAQGKTPEEVATAWLSAAGPANTFPFGTRQGTTLFFEKLLDEVEAFFCRDDQYVEDKKKLLTGADTTKAFIVSVISAAIAPRVGAAAPCITTPVALILLTVGRMGRNAWCATRSEQRAANE